MRSTAHREDTVNHTPFPPYGTWYSRYAGLYTEAPQPVSDVPDTVTELPRLPRLVAAA